MRVHYLDTSALVKLVRREPETDALSSWLEHRTWLISDLQRTELRRAARRAGPRTAARAEHLLAEVDVLGLDGSTYDLAGRLDPPSLRSLDALHLAAAMTLGDDLAGVVAYDGRLLEAARLCGIEAISPS